MPWDSVLPEYQQGLDDADLAFKALENSFLQVAITYEETAAAAWEQALVFLINPPKKTPQPQQAQANPNGPQPKGGQNQPPQPSESMQQLLMNLQEMEMDTHPNAQSRGIKLNEVDKPW